MKAEDRAKLKVYDYTGLRAGDKHVSIGFVQSILPGDPNYFPTNPSWAEYVIEARVLSDSITLKNFRLVGASGMYVDPAQSSAEIAKRPSIQGEVVEGLAVTAVAAGAATGAAMATASVVGILAAPVIIGGYYAYKAGTIDSAIEYDKEFARRVPHIGSTVDKNSVMRGSVFFPLLENPRAFVLEYAAADGATRQLRIDIVHKGGMQTATEAATEDSTKKAKLQKQAAKKKASAIDPTRQ
jgi:hypothetical protein